MSICHERITRSLKRIGACWAVRSDKFCGADDSLEDRMDGRKTYHIHPDASYPHVNSVEQFDSLREIEEWIAEMKAA